jgi:hypothetical protein
VPTTTLVRYIGTKPARQRWYAPLLWIAITPFITVPLTWAISWGVITWGTNLGICTYHRFFWFGEATCPVGITLAALAPGLANLVPILWLGRKDSKTRAAAWSASVLGGLRLIGPAIGILLTSPNATIYDSWFWPPAPDTFPAVPGPEATLYTVALSICLWLFTFVAIAVIAVKYKDQSGGQLA